MIDNEKLKNIFAEVLSISPEQIDENTSMDNTKNWDSLAHLNLILTIEEVFKIKFPMEKISDLTTFAKIKEALEK